MSHATLFPPTLSSLSLSLWAGSSLWFLSSPQAFVFAYLFLYLLDSTWCAATAAFADVTAGKSVSAVLKHKL